MTTDTLIDLATARHRAGDLLEARRLYEQALATAPDDARALFRIGLLDLQENRPASALVRIERAVATDPEDPRYQMGLGRTLQSLGRLRAAIAAYRTVLAITPEDADARFALATALQAAGEDIAAVAAYRASLEVDPRRVDALNNLGVLLGARREFPAAEAALRNALAIQPTNAAATFNLGKVLHDLARPEEAISLYRRSVELRPDHAEALCNLGNVHKELGELDAAEHCYTEALRVRPNSVLGWNNLGCLMRTTGRFDEAEQALRQGLLIDPQHAALHDNLGSVLKDVGEIDAAIDSFRRALAIDPCAAATHSNLLYALSFQSSRPEPILEEARRWGGRFAAEPANRPAAPPADRSPERALRIGYVSPDFRDHCQSLFTLPLLAKHDRGAFRIHCYSDVVRADEYTRRVRGHADVWRDTRALGDAELATLIGEDRIDVLVDLTMHMAGGRPGLFVRKPAPLQICWLAYPGTTGIAAIDCRLSDPRLDPPGSERHYVEPTIRLPDSFWCYEAQSTEACGPLPALRNGFVTFGCLNNPCKLSEPTLDLWSALMRALPNSRLILLAPPGRRRAGFAGRFAARGVDPARIDFLAFRPRREYLRAYQQIDIGLDTLPYNGHTTSLDALWMGVPVISRIGDTCVGRGGLSQLYQLGLAELAADSDEAFVRIALALAGDADRLAAMRAELRARMQRSPLMNAERFARNLEHIYRGLWREMLAATAPRV